jgi:hypothetical protein
VREEKQEGEGFVEEEFEEAQEVEASMDLNAERH